jgi:hypothetical protein
MTCTFLYKEKLYSIADALYWDVDVEKVTLDFRMKGGEIVCDYKTFPFEFFATSMPVVLVEGAIPD